MPKYKNLITLILSVLLFVFILLLVVNIAFKNNIFNVSWYKNTSSIKGINKEVKDKVEEKLKLVTLESNFPKELYQGIVTDDMINNNIDKILEENVKALKGEDYNKDVVNVDDILNVYNQRIDDYIKSKNVVVDDVATRVLNDIKFKAKVEVEIAASSTNFWVFLENHKTSFVLDMISNMSFLSNSGITILCIIIILLLTLGMLILNLKDMHTFFKYTGMAIFISGVLPFSLGFSGNLSKISKNIMFMGSSANKLLTELVNSVFNLLFNMGLALVILGTIFVLLSSLFNLRRSRSSLRNNA